MTLDQLSRWASVIATLLNAGCAVYVYMARRALASRNELRELDNRIIKLEGATENTPGWGALRKISDRLAEIDGDLKAVKAVLDGHVTSVEHLRGSIDTIQTYLLENRK